MSKGESWTRVSRRRQCPICEKCDWCLYAGPDDAPTAAICARVESSQRCGQAGWLHRLHDSNWRPPAVRIRRVATQTGAASASASVTRDWRRYVDRCEAALGDDRLDTLAEGIGVSADALRRLWVGWSSEHGAFSFPMLDAAGEVLGVRLRNTDGRKWSVRGGREGLFFPRTDQDYNDGRLIVCEGATDCAALIDLGLLAIGRPSCSGGVRLVVEFVQKRGPADVAILADADPPGLRGAYNLASVLALYTPIVRVVTPPAGVKDARAWKSTGLTREEVLARIEAAETRSLAIVVKGGLQ